MDSGSGPVSPRGPRGLSLSSMASTRTVWRAGRRGRRRAAAGRLVVVGAGAAAEVGLELSSSVVLEVGGEEAGGGLR